MTGLQVKPRVLIVDDQPANIRVMAEALRDECELFFATSGAKALEIAGTGEVDLVLLDVVMPEMNGFDVCRELKADERTAKIPVIFVTAREESHDEEKGFDLGAVDYIAKPIRPPLVRARVRTQLELKRSRDLLERLASVDALTGVANRRQFDIVLEQEWQRAARNGAPLTLLMIDVDDFKAYNDTYGHSLGDDCLRAIAMGLLTVARRPTDLAARYGGEEFAIVLSNTDGDAARTLTRLLLSSIRELALEHSGSRVCNRVTISCGAVTTYPRQGGSIPATISAADALLYEVKAGGRNHAIHLDLSTDTRTRIPADDTVGVNT